MMREWVTRHIIVRGRVQGVGFRVFVRDVAVAFDIRGWVKNNPDGSLELVAHGIKENFQSFVEQIEIGPPSSRVDQVEVQTSEIDTSDSMFRIIA